MLYPRQIFPKLEAELTRKEATVITGMRRVGKTTILNHLYDTTKSDNKALFDLENPLHRKIFEEKDYDLIWENLRQFGLSNQTKAFLFIDEVQNLPEISRVVKYLYDHWNVKFVLTGSSSFYLRNLFPESLAGRKIVFEVFPLTFAEFLVFRGKERMIGPKNEIAHQKLTPYYEDFLEFGGFPGVVLEENRERKKVLLFEIFTSYFEKDAKNLADFKDMGKLRDLILLLVPRIASRLEINKLASELATSRETIYNYLAFLEQTYFISLLPKHSASPDRQAAGSKKLFFCDLGLANVLGRVSAGQLLEQSVFQNLRTNHHLSFYSKGEASEIDFIVDKKVALEVKTSPGRRDLANLQKRAKSARLSEYRLVSWQFNKDPNITLATSL